MLALARRSRRSPPARPALAAIEQQLQGLVSTKSADVGIAAIDLATGESISVKGNTPFPMASTMKIAVAAAYLAQVDHGRRSLNESIGKTTARAQMERMMINSDNAATDRLIRNLGGPKAIQDWLDFNSIRGMRVDRDIARLLADPRDLWDRRDSSTPLAMAQFLRRLDREAILSPSSKAILFDMMRRCKTGKNRIRSLLPADAQVQHKTGTLNGYTSDVGYISLPDGRKSRAGDLRPRRRRPAAHHRRSGADALRRLPLGHHLEFPAAAHLRPIMLLHIVSRGKIGRSSEADLVDRYVKRIAWPMRLTELPDTGGKMPAEERDLALVVLDEKGRDLSSTELAKLLAGLARQRASAKRAS